MAFGQLTHRESLSDTLICLKANAGKMYHMGIGEVVAKSTLSKANENRSYRIYEDLAMLLIAEAKQLYLGDSNLEVEIKNNVFAIDATTIDLCLSAFYWATFRSTKGGIKLHTQLDLKTSIPEFILFSTASVHDVNVLDVISFEANSFYVMDRGYVDYKRLYKIHQCDAFFVTRAKSNMDYRRLYSHTVDKTKGVICDQTIRLNGYYPAKDYPQKMRRVKFYDEETRKHLIFLSNNFHLTANQIAQLYKHRWFIELFFKWIKQHLKIKSFWGHSENAVKTQVWIAVSVYVLVLIAKKKFMLKQSPYEILQILSISIFEKMPINQLFQQTQLQYFKEQKDNQLKMFD
jgi:transposase